MTMSNKPVEKEAKAFLEKGVHIFSKVYGNMPNTSHNN